MRGILRPLAALFLVFSAASQAAAPTDVVAVDFATEIERQATGLERFALRLVRSYDLADGRWDSVDGEARWQLQIDVPQARSLSFHADDIAIPSGGRVLLHAASGESFQHQRRHWSTGELWSRPLPGERLTLEIRVPLAEQHRVRLHLRELQVAYRDLNDPGNDHPAYAPVRERLLREQAAAEGQIAAKSDIASCSLNYACEANDGNRRIAQSTVQVIFGNAAACTGTLVADTEGSYRTYIATAQHCALLAESTGADGGSFSFNWNAEVACDAAMKNARNAATGYSQGGIVRAVYQDLLLIEANDPPPHGSFPYWAGWDAVTNAASFDYAGRGPMESVHHASQQARQYFSARNADAERMRLTDDYLGGSYYFDAWVFKTTYAAGGQVKPGASGAGAFVGGRLVGTLSGAPTTQSCAPNDVSKGMFQRFDKAWKAGSGSDRVRYWLDPVDSGEGRLDGRFDSRRLDTPAITLSLDKSEFKVGGQARLSWSIQRGADCTVKAPGVNGLDNLFASGTAESGTQPVSASLPGAYTITLSCASEGGRVRYRSVSFAIADENVGAPSVQLASSSTMLTEGESLILDWNAENADRCVAQGAWSGELPTSGSRTLQPAAGARNFRLQCERAGVSTLAESKVQVFAAPRLQLNNAKATIEAGDALTLSWDAADAEACIASGDWFGPLPVSGSMTLYPQAGDRRFELVCYGPTADVSQVTAVKVEAPVVSSPAPASGGGSDGGGGGGGAMDLRVLAGLSLLALVALIRRRALRRAAASHARA